MSLEEMEQQANQLIERGETDLAIRQIYDLVLAWAKKKDFKKANAWREKLIEINPMALAEILNSGEVIESERTKVIDFYHQKIWANLYVSLTQEEGNAIYLKLKQKELPPGEVLIQQGKINNTLFFVDSGLLKTFFSQGGKEIFLNEVGQGYTAGRDTFFSISICTSTVVTVSPVKLMILDRPGLLEVEKEFSGFTKKLEGFCSRLEANNYKTILKNKTLERRQHQRHKLAAKITVQIYDKKKNPVGRAFTGRLDDISVGGASFFIQSSNKDVGRTLLGRLISLSLQDEKGPEVKFNGFIIGARFDDRSGYTINHRFLKPYDESKLKEIVANYPPSTPTPPSIA